MLSTSRQLYEFGPFRVDPSKRRLLKDGEPVSVTPKAFDTLLALIVSRGSIVEKEDLMDKVWPGVAVEENNLTQNISALRKALGEKRDEPQYILTVPGRGYRFVAEVSALNEAATGAVDETVAAQPVGPPAEEAAEANALHRSNRARASTPRTIAGVLLAAAIAIAGVYLWVTKARGHETATTEIRSIAVLPFRPLAGEAGGEYLGLGMADALITKFSNIKPIVVRPTSSVVKYANSSQDLLAIGRELDVDSVLEGRVQESSDRIRVTVTLVRVSDGAPLWANKFDEKKSDLFTVEDRISEQVAGSLLPALTGTQKAELTKHYTEDTDAYQFYIQGRYWWNKRNAEGLKKAIGYYEDAILKDPNYALAYAGLADSYATLRLFHDSRPEDLMPKAQSAAMRALALDDGLAEAHASLGYVKHRYEWDFAGAEREFKRAIDLKPDYATAHQWYGWYLVTMGAFDAGLDEFKRAQQLDPLSLYVNLTVGAPYFFTKQYDKAQKQFAKVVEMDPGFLLGHRWLAKAYLQEGRYEEAIAEFEKVKRMLGGGPTSVPAIGYIDALTGKQPAARAMIEELKKNREHGSSYYVAIIYAGLGEKDNAFDWLSKARQERLAEMVDAKIDPQLESLHSDPRFGKLLESIGFPR